MPASMLLHLAVTEPTFSTNPCFTLRRAAAILERCLLVLILRAAKDKNLDLMKTIDFIHDCLDNASSAWARFQAFT